MKKIAIICLMIGLLVSCGDKKQENQKVEEEIFAKVKTAIIQPSFFEKNLSLTGEIEAINSVKIFPKVSAKVLSYNLEDGTVVDENTYLKKGQLFAYLDKEELEIQCLQAQAGLKAATANFNISHLSLLNSEKEKERTENLYDKKVISEKQRELSFLEWERAKAIYVQAASRVEEAEATVKKANLYYEEAYVKAPIDGVLAKIYISEQNIVAPNHPLALIADLSEVKITVGVPEKIIPQIECNNVLISVKIDSLPNKKIAPSSYKVLPLVDRSTRMGTMELKIKNDDIKNLIRPGMFAKVNLSFKKIDKIIKIPVSTVIHLDGKSHVFIFKNERANLSLLKLGERNNTFVEVLEGLEENDEIIIHGINNLTDQLQVERIEDIK